MTLDNPRVPFVTDGKFKILSFRSRDPVFKTDPGVIPDEETQAKAGITVVQTGYQHTDMSDRGPDEVKTRIGGLLEKFLDENDEPDPLTPALPKLPATEPDALALSSAAAPAPAPKN